MVSGPLNPFPILASSLTLSSFSHRLAKIKAWIDENSPGDMLIPFSVALEERLANEFGNPEAQQAELEKLGTTGALGKITSAGYASLKVGHTFIQFSLGSLVLIHLGLVDSLFDTSLVGRWKLVLGPFEKEQRHLKLLV